MALNKDICKKCLERNTHIKWHDIQETNWMNGRMPCPTSISKHGIALVKDDAPSYCPYLLEHEVSQ